MNIEIKIVITLEKGVCHGVPMCPGHNTTFGNHYYKVGVSTASFMQVF